MKYEILNLFVCIWLLMLVEYVDDMQQYDVMILMIGNDEELLLLVVCIVYVMCIDLQFLLFIDGCVYSQVYLLCKCYGFVGDLCVIGDVLVDQLLLMECMGFLSVVFGDVVDFVVVW